MTKDITYCTGEGCDKKESCKRYMDQSPKSAYYFNKPPFVKKMGVQSCCHYKKYN